MANSKGHTPMWPAYIPKGYKSRSLLLLEKRKLYDSQGKMVLHTKTFDDLTTHLFNSNALVFVSSLTNKTAFPFLSQSVSSDNAKVSCTKKGKPTSITIAQGNEKRKIVPLSTWRPERKAYLDPDFLLHMEDLYTFCRVGSQATPGALGHAMMLQSWGLQHLRRHTAPNMLCQAFLWEHHVGGRCDTPGLGNFYSEAIELDMSSAYLAYFMEHPTGLNGSYGAGCFFLGESGASHYVTYFVECDVHIPSELPLGPFPIKVGKYDTIKYPVLPGTYRAFLWKEQIDDCIRAGCDIRISRGFGWKNITTDNGGWAKELYHKRMEVYGTDLERDIKSIIVAGIGRHGMKNTFHELTTLDDGKSRYLYDDSDKPTSYLIKETKDYNQPAMSHWYGYTIMQCSRALYNYSLQPAIEGRLIMTNYDALLVTELNESTLYPEKHTLAAKMVEAGDLRWQKLTNVKVLAPRSLDCDQKTIRPGVPLEERAA